MPDRNSSSHTEDPRLVAALADYLERIDRGDAVSREEFLARHGDIADELRRLLTTSEELAQLRPSGEPAIAPPAEVATRSQTARSIDTDVPQAVRAPASDATASQRLPESFGRYRILHLLGSGAMGEVYLAEDTQLCRKVALKTPVFEEDETGELLERFYREARSAAVLRHPNICPTYDVGEIAGRHYISMAYIENQPLSAYIRPDKPQSARQALIVVRKLALALQEAHDQGIIHRDLKPANVMIDSKGEPIVMDFGLARAVQSDAASRLTQSGMLVRSPAYMSPEQVEADPMNLTPATDQYSLGVILYELLTGVLPFRGGVTAVIGAILTKQPTPPGELRADLDPRINDLCLKMISKSPTDRFPSMRAVADAVTSLLKAEAGVRSPRVAQASSTARERHRTLQRQDSKRNDSAAAVASAAPITASNIQSLAETAADCLRRHDYEQVVRMLEGVPEARRTEEIRTLLNKARRLSDEVALLLAEIDAAERLNDNEALARKADRLLKLKPGHRKALQIQEELSRYGRGRIWKAGGWTPAGRRIGEGSWIPSLPLAVGGAAFGLTLLCVMLYLRVGDAVVRVEIHHPDVEVSLQNRTLNIHSAGQELEAEPGEETLRVRIGETEFETRQFTLNRGENPALVVELIDKMLLAKFGDQMLGEWPVDPRSGDRPNSDVSVPEPIGHWTFDGQPLGQDAMGNFRQGELRGRMDAARGYLGGAVHISAAQSEMLVRSETPRKLQTVTLAGWVKVDPNSGGGRVIGWESEQGSVTLNVSATAANVDVQIRSPA